jgi:hypothetical protein
MPKLTFRNSHGQLVDISTVAATKVKNECGRVSAEADMPFLSRIFVSATNIAA